jgi:methyl halide transferase
MDPVDWQQRYMEQDTPWDKGRSHPLLHDAIPYFIEGDFLVPGCGRGWDARALRDSTSQATIIGIDLAPLAIADARQLHGEDRFLWCQGDFFDNEDDSRFSAVRNVWEHTCLCALPPTMRAAYVERIAGLLPSGGMLCGIFFTHLDDENDGPPWNTSPTELLTLYGSWFELIHQERATQSFPGREQEESFFVFRRK